MRRIFMTLPGDAAAAAAAVLFLAVARRFFFLGTYDEFHALPGAPPANFFQPRVLLIAALIGVYFAAPFAYVVLRNRKEP